MDLLCYRYVHIWLHHWGKLGEGFLSVFCTALHPGIQNDLSIKAARTVSQLEAALWVVFPVIWLELNPAFATALTH